MKTPIALTVALAAVIAVGVSCQKKPKPVEPPAPPVVVVPLEHPPAVGGGAQGEPPSANEPQPVQPTEEVPIEHPPATGGNGEGPNVNVPQPVVPDTGPMVHPPAPSNETWRTKCGPPKPNEKCGPPKHHKPVKKPKHHKPNPHYWKPVAPVNEQEENYVPKGIDPKLWDMQRHYFYYN